MITCIEALHYRALRHVSQRIGQFQVLVGANASGKSTFLDVPAFLGDFVRAGLSPALSGDPRLNVISRASDPRHLTWLRKGDRFELAVELLIPDARRTRLQKPQHTICRYEVAVECAPEVGVSVETVWLKSADEAIGPAQRSLFPSPQPEVDHIVHLPRKHAPTGWKKVVSRGEEPEKVSFTSETSAWTHPFKITRGKSALASLPEDEEKFPVATWARRVLTEGVQRIALESEAMRRPSPPGRAQGFLPDGSNLPWVVHTLEETEPSRHSDWIQHVREALPDIVSITTRERDEDRHRYLVVKYDSGLDAPSWLLSDGTLRLLALTLLAYVPNITGTYLVEEPENGIHPRAVETVYQSLSSVYDAQILCATHSPVVLSMAQPDKVLCFARDGSGATDIVRGDGHPGLRAWKGDVDLGTLFASGVLG